MSIKDDIAKAHEKVKRDKERVRELKKRMMAEQEAEIVKIVRKSNLSIEELRVLLGNEEVEKESEDLENE